ncbi:hypothetical protein QYE76_044257 [Lolium multiflorum]|uniref:Reverse transcriptase domain-containing protein n=1 Tax=Lolium multiflorum TaxID=4521 RepID=A0AAD8TIG1_LOLMU|nr:hypothetical protein QYE76_044257 [Lolium multiflorum]
MDEEQADMPAVGNPAGTTHFQPADNTKRILLDPAQPDKYVTIGAEAANRKRAHQLPPPEAKPVKQPLGRFAEERRKAIGEEIARLLAAGFIMEVLHPDWLANPVLVLKKNGSWRMCIDYTSLNKACPKDPPAAHRSSATYQRCMQKCLRDQIGRNVHAYVDDVVVKTKEMPTLLDDLRETFTNLRRFRMKLNPAKCTFGVPAGQLLGYLVSRRGIEANPEKISAIEKMELPQCLKDVQFTGCWPP